MKWIKTSERVPNHKNLVHIKYSVRLNDEPPYITTAFFDGKTWHRQDQMKGFDLPESIEWLDEYAPLAEPVEGMRWVKASERLPSVFKWPEDYLIHYKVDGRRADGNLIEREGEVLFHFVDEDGDNYVHELGRVEWLDESSTPSAREAELEREVERLRKDYLIMSYALRDIDLYSSHDHPKHIRDGVGKIASKALSEIDWDLYKSVSPEIK